MSNVYKKVNKILKSGFQFNLKAAFNIKDFPFFAYKE